MRVFFCVTGFGSCKGGSKSGVAEERARAVGNFEVVCGKSVGGKKSLLRGNCASNYFKWGWLGLPATHRVVKVKLV